MKPREVIFQEKDYHLLQKMFYLKPKLGLLFEFLPRNSLGTYLDTAWYWNAALGPIDDSAKNLGPLF